jgi:hypothetical protein
MNARIRFTITGKETIEIISRKNVPQAPEPIIMPQVVHAEGGELHETQQRTSVKHSVLEPPRNSPEQTGWPTDRIRLA